MFFSLNMVPSSFASAGNIDFLVLFFFFGWSLLNLLTFSLIQYICASVILTICLGL